MAWVRPARLVKGARFARCERPVVQGTVLHGKEEENFVERADLLNRYTKDPHGGWCGGWELETPGYPIRPQADAPQAGSIQALFAASGAFRFFMASMMVV